MGKQPSINQLHLFGSVCFANVNLKQKLDPRSKRGIFVGYDKYSPSYLIYFPEINSVMKSATVNFTEKLQFESGLYTPVVQADPQHENNCLTPFDAAQQIYGPTGTQDLAPTQLDHQQANEAEAVPSHDIPNPVNEPEPRYPRRVRNPPKYLEDYCRTTTDVCYKVSCEPTPVTYKQASESNESEEWNKAMLDEMESLRDNEVFESTALPPGKKVVGSRWVFSRKIDADENIIHKARFVAKGFAQIEGTDYTDTFAPTAKMDTIRMLIQIAAHNNMPIHQLDVKTAYLT